MGVHLGHVPVRPPWKEVVQVATVHKLALVPIKARHVHHDEGDNRAIELFCVDVADKVVNHPDAVELIAVNGRRQPEHRAVPFSASNQQRKQDILGQPVGYQVDVETRQLAAREVIQHELATAMNRAGHAVVEVAFHASGSNSDTASHATHGGV